MGTRKGGLPPAAAAAAAEVGWGRGFRVVSALLLVVVVVATAAGQASAHAHVSNDIKADEPSASLAVTPVVAVTDLHNTNTNLLIKMKRESGELPAVGSNITCKVFHEELECEGVLYFPSEVEDDIRWIIFYGFVSFCLVCTAGLMSGLTIGLMSLNVMSLQVLEQSGTPKEKRYASKILPVVKKHHLLLVTLLLANAAAMEALPLFLDRMMNPFYAVLVSVTLVLFFGEVIPQALCTRFGLAIGANTAWLVKLLMIGLFVIAWPLSKLLDLILGHEHLTYFRRAELRELVKQHEAAGPLMNDEVTIILGALDMIEKTAVSCMTPMEKVFCLDINDVLDYKTMTKLLDSGHSRVPITNGSKENIEGLLLVKNLIVLNPADAVPIRDLKLNYMPTVFANTPLYDILNEFQNGKSHMALVANSEDTEYLGIITLEDVIEELIQEEIMDETDKDEDVSKKLQMAQKLSRVSSQITRAVRKSISLQRDGSSAV
ncbi:CNNM transmembrane domain-containing protein [Balamuthia mandrillaris]